MKQRLFTKRFFLSLVLITVGAIISATALEIILIPNKMIDGGMNGVSIIINTLFGGSLGLIIFLINLPFLILGYKTLGKKFLIKAGYAMILFSTLLEVFHRYNPLIDNTLLATVYGGIALGVGVGIIIKLVFIVPLISAIYRMGFNLLYGDLFSSIISYIVVIILLIISNKNKYKINFAKKFDLILNAIYYNILLCIVLLLTSLIVSVKVVSRINAIKVILVYLFISYLYIFIRGRRDKNERIIIRNKK